MNYLPTAHVLVMTPRFDAFTIEFIYYPRATVILFVGPWVIAAANRLLKVR